MKQSWSNRAGDWFLICIMLYIIWKLVICRTSSTINNYRIYIETREKGKNVLINSGDLIGHRDVTSQISAVYVCSTRWRKFLKEGVVAQTQNLQGTCILVWHMCHVSFDPEGSKLTPQGSIWFFSLMPSSSDTLWRNFTKFGTRVQCNKGFQNMYKLGGWKK